MAKKKEPAGSGAAGGGEDLASKVAKISEKVSAKSDATKALKEMMNDIQALLGTVQSEQNTQHGIFNKKIKNLETELGEEKVSRHKFEQKVQELTSELQDFRHAFDEVNETNKEQALAIDIKQSADIEELRKQLAEAHKQYDSYLIFYFFLHFFVKFVKR